jgi:integrase
MRSTREPLRNHAKAERYALEEYEKALLRSRGKEPEMILREAFKEWVSTHLLRKSASHIENMDRCGRLHLGQLADLPLTQVSTRLVEDELGRFLQIHAASTSNQWLTYLRIVCKWAIRREMIRSMPFDVPETKIKKKPKLLIPTSKADDWLAEVDALTEHDPGLGMVLRLMIGLGLRGSEARQARWEWLDLEREIYTPGDTKGGEAWPRPVPPWILEDLRAQHQTFGWMAPTLAGAPVTPGRVKRVFEAACRAVEIPRLVPHRLRATYATWLSEVGVPIQDIQAALGHKDIRTTAVYLGVDLARIAQGQRKVAAKTGMGRIKNGAGEA